MDAVCVLMALVPRPSFSRARLTPSSHPFVLANERRLYPLFTQRGRGDRCVRSSVASMSPVGAWRSSSAGSPELLLRRFLDDPQQRPVEVDERADVQPGGFLVQ